MNPEDILDDLTSTQLQKLKHRINQVLEARRTVEIQEVRERVVELARKNGFELAELGMVPARKKRGRPPGKAVPKKTAKKPRRNKKPAAKKIRTPIRGRMVA